MTALKNRICRSSPRVQELAEKYGVQDAGDRAGMALGQGRGVPYRRRDEGHSIWMMPPAALAVKLTEEDIAYLEEPYLPHRIVGAIDRNPPQGVMLLDETAAAADLEAARIEEKRVILPKGTVLNEPHPLKFFFAN